MMNQTPMLTIAGHEYPCRVTMGAMVRFKRQAGYDVSSIDEKAVSDLVLFMWCCVVSACKADDVVFELSFEDFADRLEPDTLGTFLGVLKSDDEKKSPATE